LGTQGLLREIPVNKVKAFESQFLLEMETKLRAVLAEIKKGQLNDESLKKMTDLATGLFPQFK
jgi:F-type H+-transporting ATPase subunit alpha